MDIMSKVKTMTTVSGICSAVAIGLSFYNFNGAMTNAVADQGAAVMYGVTAIPTVVAIAALVIGVSARIAVAVYEQTKKEENTEKENTQK